MLTKMSDFRKEGPAGVAPRQVVLASNSSATGVYAYLPETGLLGSSTDRAAVRIGPSCRMSSRRGYSARPPRPARLRRRGPESNRSRSFHLRAATAWPPDGCRAFCVAGDNSRRARRSEDEIAKTNLCALGVEAAEARRKTGKIVETNSRPLSHSRCLPAEEWRIRNKAFRKNEMRHMPKAIGVQ